MGATSEPVAGALVKISEGSRALMTLPARGRALVKLVPEPVQLELRKISTGGAYVCREIFAGILVVGLIAIVGGYGRLARGPISLPSLVDGVEQAINEQLSDMHVKIDDAFLQRSPDGPGVLFRLAQYPSHRPRRLHRGAGAAGGYRHKRRGASLRPHRCWQRRLHRTEAVVLFIRRRPVAQLLSSLEQRRGEVRQGLRPRRCSGRSEVQPGTPPESVIAKPSMPTSAGRQLDVTRTVADVFERARRGNTSYLTRFGVKDAQVVLSREGGQTLWQVPDFSIDLQHKNERSILVGQADLASNKGNWQLEFRTEQRPLRKSLSITALIQHLVPSGLAENFPPPRR